MAALWGCSSKEKADDETSAEKVPATSEAKQPQQQMSMEDLAAKRTPLRDEQNPIVTIATDLGNMTLELYRDVAPAHADSFLARAGDGFYNGTIFHRVIKGFMIQGGDPQGTGMGGAGYTLKEEFSNLPHEEGTLSMARSRDVNSASSQFFICLARRPGLDGQYTVFGHLIKGYDVLHKIGNVEVVRSPAGEMAKPKNDVHVREAYLSNAEGDRI